MSSKRRKGRAGSGKMVFRPVKLTPEEQQHHAEIAELERLLKSKRRPEHVPLFRKYLDINLNRHTGDLERRGHAKSVVPVDPWLLAADTQRDLYVRELMRGSDTVLYFAGEKFCDLIEAVDAPPVTDLSVLRRIGNKTAVILYARNILTGVPGDGLVAVTVSLVEDRASDGRSRLLGSISHEDNSISTFMHGFDEVDEGLATIDWGSGYVERVGSEVMTEGHLISNTLALLAQQSVFTVTEWKHYPKAVVTAAAKERRKLPPINVLGLTRYVQKDLDEHHEARHIERDFCWPVRGHFRMQAYGPERKLRRLKLVRPHIKGNLEGPLISRPQVHAAK